MGLLCVLGPNELLTRSVTVAHDQVVGSTDTASTEIGGHARHSKSYRIPEIERQGFVSLHQ